MKDYFASWYERILRMHYFSLESAITVDGKCDRHLGGHHWYARLKVRLEPATHFEVSSDNPEIRFRIQSKAQYAPGDFVLGDDRIRGFLDGAVHGFLDSILPNEEAPKPEFRVVFEEIGYCPFDSTDMAFLNAGRDAGQKFVEMFHKERLDEIRSRLSQRQKAADE